MPASLRNLFPFFLSLLIALPAAADDSAAGKLKVHVSPRQAYVFVDGKAVRDGSQTINLTAGSHEVSVHNYGYTAVTKTVQIDSGKTTDLVVELQKSGDKVSGPFGYIELKGDRHAAVLLNGTTPDYFVGHVDEFDWDWLWHQRLLVKGGTYNLTVTRGGNTIWSGPVTVKPGEKVVVYLDKNGKEKTKNWAKGDKFPAEPRFIAGIANTTVPIAPVTAQLAAQSSSVQCGQSDQLNWNTADAVAVSISDLGDVAATGDRTVSPTRTTNYQLVAKGPGGEVTQTATVDVNIQPAVTFTASRQEVRFHRIGNKIVQDDPVTLNWSAQNASEVTIAPLGNESVSGSQTVNPQPAQSATGPVSETVNYTLSASNPCGGTSTQTASVHVIGSIDPAPPVTLASIFYPSNFPKNSHPKVGLVASEKAELTEAANRFKEHEQYADDNATLVVVGHADVRGPQSYNLKLSERRAELVKNYLASQGIPAEKIEVRAEGKKQQLGKNEVAKLQSGNQQKPDSWMADNATATWMAYNRRVDIVLQPAGTQSTEEYPNAASDARLLWQRAEPSLQAVESAGQSTSATASLQQGPQGN
ncbi:MAG TPA: OmpA family protein [Candidatus Binatia bacterium]|nr:OmpA family protein [Candidatus Binatia bacterium]